MPDARKWTEAEINAALKQVDAVRARTGDRTGFADLAEFGFDPVQLLAYVAAHTDHNFDKLKREKDVVLSPREAHILGWLDGILVGLALSGAVE